MEIAGVVERVERIAGVRADPPASRSTITSGLVALTLPDGTIHTTAPPGHFQRSIAA
jgi:hypothetical protein